MPEEPKPQGFSYTDAELKAIDYLRAARQTGKSDPKIYQESVDILFPKQEGGRKAIMKNTWALAYGPQRAYEIVKNTKYASQIDPNASIALKLPNEGVEIKDNGRGGFSDSWAASNLARTRNVFSPEEGGSVTLATPKFDPFEFIGSHELGHWENALGAQRGGEFSLRPELRVDPTKVKEVVSPELITRSGKEAEALLNEDYDHYFRKIFEYNNIKAETIEDGVKQLLAKAKVGSLTDLVRNPEKSGVILDPVITASGVHGRNPAQSLAAGLAMQYEMKQALGNRAYEDFRDLRTTSPEDLSQSETKRLRDYNQRLENAVGFRPERYDENFERGAGYGYIPEEFTADTISTMRQLSSLYGIDFADKSGKVTAESINSFLNQIQGIKAAETERLNQYNAALQRGENPPEYIPDPRKSQLSDFPRVRILQKLMNEESATGKAIKQKMNEILQQYSAIKQQRSEDTYIA